MTQFMTHRSIFGYIFDSISDPKRSTGVKIFFISWPLHAGITAVTPKAQLDFCRFKMVATVDHRPL